MACESEQIVNRMGLIQASFGYRRQIWRETVPLGRVESLKYWPKQTSAINIICYHSSFMPLFNKGGRRFMVVLNVFYFLEPFVVFLN